MFGGTCLRLSFGYYCTKPLFIHMPLVEIPRWILTSTFTKELESLNIALLLLRSHGEASSFFIPHHLNDLLISEHFPLYLFIIWIEEESSSFSHVKQIYNFCIENYIPFFLIFLILLLHFPSILAFPSYLAFFDLSSPSCLIGSRISVLLRREMNKEKFNATLFFI